MKRSLAISFAIAVVLTIWGMGQPLYAQPTPKSRTLPTPIPRTLPAPTPPAACCSITAINTSTGVVTAKENATGKIFQFKVANSALLNSLKVGQGVYANFATGQVSLDGSTMCCAIMPPAPPPLPPANSSGAKTAAPSSAPAGRPILNQVTPPLRQPASPSGSAPPASPAQPPTFFPVGAGFFSIYDLQKGVALADATTGAVIHYTTDGSIPTTSSTRYAGAIPVSSTTTIKAMATASGMTNSAITTATYTIVPPTCPAGAVMEGVDVSQSQGTIDWNKVRASGRTFAYAQASIGLNTQDPSFSQNYAAIKAAGLVRGAYQTFDAAADPIIQADRFISTIGTLQPGDLPPALHVNSQDLLQLFLSAGAGVYLKWMSRVQAATGRTPIVYYASFSSLQPDMGSEPSGGSVWISNWRDTCPTLPAGWHQWMFWQYAGTGTVPGIQGSVHLNRFNGTLADLISLAKLSSAPAASNVSPVINEIDTDDLSSQFIELFNPGSSAYDLNGHCVVVRSGIDTSDTLLVSFNTTTFIPSKGYFLLASPLFTAAAPDAIYRSSRIGKAEGVVALRHGAANAGTVIDSVAYGSAANPFLQTASAPFPPAGSSISRLPNGSNTHNNLADFKVRATPTPGQPNQ